MTGLRLLRVVAQSDAMLALRSACGLSPGLQAQAYRELPWPIA